MGVISFPLIMSKKRKRGNEDDEYVDDGDTNDDDALFSYRGDELSAEMDDDLRRKVIKKVILMKCVLCVEATPLGVKGG